MKTKRTRSKGKKRREERRRGGKEEVDEPGRGGEGLLLLLLEETLQGRALRLFRENHLPNIEHTVRHIFGS